ncbi:MAG: hypothetical protein ACREQY_04580, partial [Candidatus Binatia bacterium]
RLRRSAANWEDRSEVDVGRGRNPSSSQSGWDPSCAWTVRANGSSACGAPNGRGRNECASVAELRVTLILAAVATASILLS